MGYRHGIQPILHDPRFRLVRQAAFGQSLTVVNMIKSNAIGWSRPFNYAFFLGGYR